MGILTNDNFSVNAPKIIDDRYSVAGVTPYASVAAANLAIALTRRAIGLTVNVAGVEYWYQAGITDPDLVIKSAGAGPSVVSITRAALQTLISTNAVVVGTTYSITDAQDALGGTITVKGVTVSSIDGTGQWNFNTRLSAQGRFRLSGGTSGSVDQIVLTTPGGPVNLMTASVPYTTSRNNTASLVVANINANSGVSGARAFVVTSVGATTFDIPFICIDYINPTTGTIYNITPSTTTLTTNNLAAATLGFTSVNAILDSSYDIVSDRILYAYDSIFDCAVTVDTLRITALGYNPIVTFRWRDPRFKGMKFINSGYNNVQFRNTNAAVGFWNNFRCTNTNIINSIFINTSQNNVDLLGTTNISNVNSISLSITGSNCSFAFSNIECASLTVSTQNKGAVSINNTAIGNATTQKNLSITGCQGNITINNSTSTGLINFASIVSFAVFTMNGLVNTGNFTVTGLRIYAGSGFSNITTTGIQIVSCEWLNTLQHTGGSFGSVYQMQNTTIFGAGFTSPNIVCPAGLFIINSYVSLTLVTASSFISTIIIDTSRIDGTNTFGKFTNATFSIEYSDLSGTLIGTASILPISLLTISKTNLVDSDLSCLDIVTITDSTVNQFIFTPDGVTNSYSLDVQSTKLEQSSAQTDPILLGSITVTDLVISNSQCFKTIFYCGESLLATYTNCQYNYSTVGLTGQSGAGVGTFNMNKAIINNSSSVIRGFLGNFVIDNINLENSFFGDNGFDVSIQDLTVNGLTMVNSSLTLCTYNPGGVSTFINNSSFINAASQSFNQPEDTVLNGVTVDNGDYTVKYTHDASVNPLAPNTPFKFTTQLNSTAIESISYSSSLTGGAGATLGIGRDSSYNEYLPDVLVTTLSSLSAFKANVTPERISNLVTDGLQAKVASITAGSIIFTIKGTSY